MSATACVVISLIFIATLPLTKYLERKRESAKMWRILRLGAALLGVIGVIAVSVRFAGVTVNYPTDTAEWARDFYFGYLKTFLTGYLIILVLLCIARLIDHPMRRTVSVLEVLLPIAALMSTVFVASMASGEIAVDGFIHATAPAVILMAHLSGVFCKKDQKNRKNP